MENHITRRHTLALTGAAFAASCVDNTGISQSTPPIEASRSGGVWSQGIPLPFPVQEIYPCAHNGALHLAGGFGAENGRITGPTEAHHTWKPGDEWTEITPLPIARHHPHLITAGLYLYAFGGFEAPSPDAGWTMKASGWRFTNYWLSVAQPGPTSHPNWPQPAPKDWFETTDIASLPVPCAEAVVGVTGNDTLHLAGGRTPKGVANANWNDHIDTDHHFVLTSLDGQWETASPCLTKRNSAAGDVINGNLHVVGGRTVGGGNVATHEVYDHAEDRWRTAAPMPQAQGGLAAAAVNGKLYAFGGEYFDNGGGVYKEAWTYDPATDVWSALPDMPTPRHGLGAVALEGKIYVIGGALQASGVDTSAIVDVFTPA